MRFAISCEFSKYSNFNGNYKNYYDRSVIVYFDNDTLENG